MGGNSPEDKMPETKRQYAANYRNPLTHTRFKKGQSGNPRGRPAKNLAALLAAALNEKVTVTENGKCRQVTKREAVIAQLINNSASAELRATKMLIDMLRDVEKRVEPAVAEKDSFSPTDKEVVQQLIAIPGRASSGRTKGMGHRVEPDAAEMAQWYGVGTRRSKPNPRKFRCKQGKFP
jgi:Family of unknown function (DUF5681)